VFSVVLIGLYDPKTGSTLGLSGPKWGHNWVVVLLTLNHVQIWVISPNGGHITLKRVLCSAFGYTRFSV
jgi:hypothetical protein